jgi:uncharacterized protein (TIGR03790 family)
MGHDMRESATALLAVLLSAAMARGQSGENILLVANEASPASLEISQYYAEMRGIPADNVLRLKAGTGDTITRQEFERRIEAQIAGWLVRNSMHDRILYIVLAMGMPLLIDGTPSATGTAATVDSELTLLYRKLTGQPVQPGGRIPNPYFLGAVPISQANRYFQGTVPISQAKPFTHEAQDVFLVTRLDGSSVEDVRGLIDRGLRPSREGKIILDERDARQEQGNGWLRAAASLLKQIGGGDRVANAPAPGALGCYSWGTVPETGFAPGGLCGLFGSLNPARMREAVHLGVTGLSALLAESPLDSAVRPDILFPAYLAGFNLAESFYLAMPSLSWSTVVVGDPLCAPFRSTSLSAGQIDKGLDPETELPAHFSPRRLRTISVPAFQQLRTHPDTIKLVLRAEVRMAKRDFDGARRFLEEATARDSRLASAQTILATLYEQAGEHDKAVTRYRRVLELNPENPIALNNLAYALAVHQNNPQEALPLAQKAYGIAKASPNICDTLGWVHHLLGDNEKARGVLEEALKGGRGSSEMHFHAAVVYDALGQKQQAAEALARALELDPEMAKREDVRRLQQKTGTSHLMRP